METPWIPAKSQIVYQAQSDENVAQPCIVRMLDGNLIILVQQKGNEPIFIRSTDGGRTWSQPYSGILPDGADEISTLGVGHNGRLITVLGHASENLGTSVVKKRTVMSSGGREYLTYEGYRYNGSLRLA